MDFYGTELLLCFQPEGIQLAATGLSSIRAISNRIRFCNLFNVMLQFCIKRNKMARKCTTLLPTAPFYTPADRQ
jgi:hypothetical protein